VDLQVGHIYLFVRGCKQPGLQPGCNKFFSSSLVFRSLSFFCGA
jgi:hypothetical protein